MRTLTDARVRRLAGDRAYAKGLAYYRAGRVQLLGEDEGEIAAEVAGTHRYTVTLMEEGDHLGHDCDCPQGEEGAFCKHCVAAALAWLSGPRETLTEKSRPKKLGLDEAVGVFVTADTATIARTLVEWARMNDWLKDRLLQYAELKSAPDRAVADARRAFDKAVRTNGYIPHYETDGWADGVDEAIDNIANLLEDGHAKHVVELCEHALEQLDSEGLGVDDSDGRVTELLRRLEDLHLQACEQVRPDPADLARRLLNLQLHSELDVLDSALERYADVLGTEGTAEYQRLAEAEWAKTGDDSETYYRIEGIMESLAKASGNVEARVAILSRDMSSAYGYLNIAQVYLEADDTDKALEWAEKGLHAFPNRTDWRLKEFAANLYHSRGRHDDAMELAWTEFCERLCFETYLNLQGHAEKSGTGPQWHDLAVAEIRSRMEKSRHDASLLVQIFLHEKDPEAAWREAQAGGCWDTLWHQLAAAREEDHPNDAAAIYLRYAEAGVKIGGGDYERPVALLIKVADLMKRMNRSEEFAAVLANLRITYRRKRNFIELLDRNRSSLCV